MAAGKTSIVFKTLKHGALLPAGNRILFPAVFALAVAYTSLLLLVNDLAVQPAADKLLLDVIATFHSNGTPDEYALLLQDLGNDAWDLAWAGTACLLLDATAGSAVWIVALLEAVWTFADETQLGKDRARLEGPALAVAFVYALQITYVIMLLAATAALLAHLLVKGPNPLLLLGWLVRAAAAVFHVYLTFLYALGFLVAVAEPRRRARRPRRGAGAVVRAWRLLRGRRRRRRAALLLAVVGALAAACSRVQALARARAHSGPASGLLLGFLYAAAVAAAKLFAVCAITAFYYECRQGDDDAANTELIGGSVL
ncbi:unnamed protein product [Urochloa decumbens]|uniref:Uncharacterized protein n=1 Tax=Urochloa decumbens TaxID=240449 RepID=A0ABC8YV02_9POAL